VSAAYAQQRQPARIALAHIGGRTSVLRQTAGRMYEPGPWSDGKLRGLPTLLLLLGHVAGVRPHDFDVVAGERGDALLEGRGC
jgi:hypothetical protein